MRTEQIPETSIVATGAGGLTIRFGDRKAFCHTGMSAEEFVAAKAACDALLREMVEAVMRDELQKLSRVEATNA